MDRVRFINHKGIEILLLDFSGCQAMEIFPIFNSAKSMISSRPHSSLLTLADVTGTQVNDTISQQVRSFTIHNKPYVKASAVVGVEGIKKVILGKVEIASKREFREFDTLEQAKDWLVEQK